MAQETAIDLVQVVLPRYDAHRRPYARPKTYLEQALWYSATKPVRQVRRWHPAAVGPLPCHELPGLDPAAAIVIENLAADVLARPGDYFENAAVVSAISDPRDLTTLKDRQAAGLAQAVAGRRARARLHQLAADLPIAGPSGRHC